MGQEAQAPVRVISSTASTQSTQAGSLRNRAVRHEVPKRDAYFYSSRWPHFGHNPLVNREAGMVEPIRSKMMLWRLAMLGAASVDVRAARQ